MTDVATAQNRVAEHRTWFIFLGAMLVIAGALAIAFPFVGGLTLNVWVAVSLLIAGIAQAVHAFGAKQWSGMLLDLLCGLLYIAVGLILWFNPIRGVIALTVFLAASLVVEGILQGVLAFQIRHERGWLWLLVAGILSIVVGVMIWRELPSSAAWSLGLLLGINLIYSGVAFLMLIFAAPTKAT
jgi:uncharacterized membrane protein HdeD (DUF308 family)